MTGPLPVGTPVRVTCKTFKGREPGVVGAWIGTFPNCRPCRLAREAAKRQNRPAPEGPCVHEWAFIDWPDVRMSLPVQDFEVIGPKEGA